MPHPRRPRPCLADSFLRLCFRGALPQAVDALPALARRGIRPDANSLALLLNQCLRSGELPLARRVHLHLKLTGLKRALPLHTCLANQVIALHFRCCRPAAARALFDRMPARNSFSYNAMLVGYSKLDMLPTARLVFDGMPDGARDVVTWNIMIVALARAGSCGEAVDLYVRMRRSAGGACSQYSFSGMLVACVGLGLTYLAQQVHGQVVIMGYLANLIISSSLVDAYVKCGCIDDARNLFTQMPVKDVLTWTTLLSGYVNYGDFVSARRLFDAMPEKNHFSWTALISGYARKGLSHEALDLFANMVNQGVGPDQFAFSSALSSCTSISSIKHGRQIHTYLIKALFKPNAVVLSCLINMYSRCGSLLDAQRLFDRITYDKRDTVLWNTMIMAFGQHGHGKRSVRLFEEMIETGTKPDSHTFTAILAACSRTGLSAEGIRIFNSMMQNHCVFPEETHYVCFVDLLGQTGHVQEALGRILKAPVRSSIVVWNSLLAACRIHNMKLVGSVDHFIQLNSQFSSPYIQLSDMCTESTDMASWDLEEQLRCLLTEREMHRLQAARLDEVESTV